MATQQADQPGVTLLLSPNAGQLGDASHKRYIIIHGTANGMLASANASFFANPASGVSAHYIVGIQGEIYQCVHESDSAWANGGVTGTPLAGGIGLPVYGNGVNRDPWWHQDLNPNLITISIEHVKPLSDNSNTLTPAQQAASFKLIRDIGRRWPSIPMRAADANGGITGHYSIDGLYRPRCPGPYPWDELFSYLAAAQYAIPQGWIDDGITLKSPNGLLVTGDIRTFVLKNGWNKDNWPLTNEYDTPQLEISNPTLGAGKQQIFRWSMLGQNAVRGVFLEWIGQELLAERKLVP